MSTVLTISIGDKIINNAGDAVLPGKIDMVGKLEEVATKNKTLTYVSDATANVLVHQPFYWNGSSFTATTNYGFGHSSLESNEGANSNGFGYQALKSNLGDSSNGFGYQSLQNNTGVSSNGFGTQSLQNNTGANSNGFGHFALYNNTGANSNGFGYFALYNNTGANSNGFGYVSLYANTGINSNGFGYRSLEHNTGANSNGFGYLALQHNTGVNNNGFGYLALQHNTGANSNGFGYLALEHNTGANSNGFGYLALRNNTGVNNNGFGYLALRNNTGANNSGLGGNTLQYNQNDNNTAIGHNAWASFLSNTGGNKIFDYTNVDAGTDRVTVTGHGFGVTNAYINLLYTQGTSAITGLTDGFIYQIKIIDANTIGFYEGSRGTDITAAGTGTGHTFTPQYNYTNSIVIGANVDPTASNQVTLGNASITQTILRGVLSFGSHSAIGAETVTGYVTITDSSGNPRKLAVVS